jgi:hypothetical protein
MAKRKVFRRRRKTNGVRWKKGADAVPFGMR